MANHVLGRYIIKGRANAELKPNESQIFLSDKKNIIEISGTFCSPNIIAQNKKKDKVICNKKVTCRND